jgi:hypothetical protein
MIKSTSVSQKKMKTDNHLKTSGLRKALRVGKNTKLVFYEKDYEIIECIFSDAILKWICIMQ